MCISPSSSIVQHTLNIASALCPGMGKEAGKMIQKSGAESNTGIDQIPPQFVGAGVQFLSELGPHFCLGTPLGEIRLLPRARLSFCLFLSETKILMRNRILQADSFSK